MASMFTLVDATDAVHKNQIGQLPLVLLVAISLLAF
jgi:hypothetical protein